MIYGERVRYARNKLGYSRIELAAALDTTERNIANIENCKDESKKLGWDKTKELIAIAELPKGYFFFDDDEIDVFLLDDTEIFTRGKGKPTDKEAKDISELAELLK